MEKLQEDNEKLKKMVIALKGDRVKSLAKIKELEAAAAAPAAASSDAEELAQLRAKIKELEDAAASGAEPQTSSAGTSIGGARGPAQIRPDQVGSPLPGRTGRGGSRRHLGRC